MKSFPVAVTKRPSSNQQSLSFPSSERVQEGSICHGLIYSPIRRSDGYTGFKSIRPSFNYHGNCIKNVKQYHRRFNKCSRVSLPLNSVFGVCRNNGKKNHLQDFINYLEDQFSFSAAFLFSLREDELWPCSRKRSNAATRGSVSTSTPVPSAFGPEIDSRQAQTRSLELTPHRSVIVTCTRPPLPSRWSRSPGSCPCCLPAPGRSRKSLCRCSRTSHLRPWGPLTPAGRTLQDKTRVVPFKLFHLGPFNTFVCSPRRVFAHLLEPDTMAHAFYLFICFVLVASG